MSFCLISCQPSFGLNQDFTEMRSFTQMLLLSIVLLLSCKRNANEYVCPPCDLRCDRLTFSKPGHCPHCKMKLVLKSELEKESNLVVNEITIEGGPGVFKIEGGADREKNILVRYYMPEKFKKDSPVIFVLPGAGRNAKDYRDVWVEAAEEYGLLILVPEYSEEHYPEFWSYNLAGMIYDVDIQSETFRINQNADEWLFQDFDRIFNLVRAERSLETNSYDMFGHSAGGQILHRLAIFKPNSKADRILASNSGWYTIPTDSQPFPYGLENIDGVIDRLDFSKNLVLFLGEKDDASETRGHLRRSPEVDIQGLHRLARGTYFFNESKKLAETKGFEFNWKLEVIPDVGHDYKEMSKQAAAYLYETSDSEN